MGKIVRLCFLFLALGIAAENAQAQSILDLAQRYNLALKAFELRKSRSSLESVLRKGTLLSDKYEELEKLSDADYLRFEKKMRGFDVNREEILFVEPDRMFFLRLAKKIGTTADRSFFRLLIEIKPNNVWASYIEQQTDYSGCTIYGNGKLTKLYGKAQRFKRTYPWAYTSYVNDEISSILEAFDGHICACGSRDLVIKEFSLFVKTFPKDKKTPAIRKILDDLKVGKQFEFDCHSG